MTAYAWPVIRWPFTVAGGSNVIRFEDNVATNSNQTITASTYLNKGENASGGYSDLITALNTAMAAASSALSLSSTFVATLETDGRVWIKRTAGSGELYIKWDHADTTFDKTILGYDNTVTSSIVDSTGEYSDFQADYQWHSGREPIFPGPETLQGITYADRDLLGRERVLNHSPSDFYERCIEWDVIKAARMITARAAEAGYATTADLQTGEGNTWEALWQWIRGAEGPAGNNDVYYYDTNDPTTHTQSGPYCYLLSKSTPGLKGVGVGEYVKDRGTEEYQVTAYLWRAG